MFSLFRTNKLDAKESVDVIETIVYKHLKPLGFRKFGRTLHRFVDGDISQVVHLQNGCPQKGVHGILWVNLGIRVPECAERTFTVAQPQKKYYHEYECNIRSRLGALVDGRDTSYDLRWDPEKIGQDIVKRLDAHVLPVFAALNSREAILKHRRQYASFDGLNRHLIDLEEAMIHGRAGDTEKAAEAFNRYYQQALEEYRRDAAQGSPIFLRKGERVTYHNTRTNQTETITAEKTGYVTMYDANTRHLDYLTELAGQLGISIADPLTEDHQ